MVYLFLKDDLPKKDTYLSCDRFFIKSFLVSNNGGGLCYITQQNGKPSCFFLFYYKQHNNKKPNTCLEHGVRPSWIWGGGVEFHQRYKILVASPSEMRSDSCSTPQSNVIEQGSARGKKRKPHWSEALVSGLVVQQSTLSATKKQSMARPHEWLSVCKCSGPSKWAFVWESTAPATDSEFF